MRQSRPDAGHACPVCGAAMRTAGDWLRKCPSCAFMMSSLPAAGGRGVSGLKSLRMRNFQIILDHLVPLMPRPAATLLEVGCAEGWFLRCAADRGLRAEGIEPDPGRLESGGPQLKVRSGYFPQALEAGARFDAIAFNDVFEHLPDPRKAIVEVDQRLVLGGVAVLNLPSSDGLVFTVARLLHSLGVSRPYERLWQKGMESPHITYFNPRNLRRFVEGNTGLRYVGGRRLAAFTRRGLWRRIASTYSVGASAAIFAVAWPASFLLELFPSDAELLIFAKGSGAPAASEKRLSPP